MTSTSDRVALAFDMTIATHTAYINEHGVPDLPIVARKEYDRPSEMFALGRLAESGYRRWAKDRRRWVHLCPAWLPGNDIKVPSSNVVAIIEPRYNDTSMASVEYGCRHQWEITAKRNCYTSRRCTECGAHYGVDSSG